MSKCKKYEFTIAVLLIATLVFLGLSAKEFTLFQNYNREIETLKKMKMQQKKILQRVVLPYSKDQMERLIVGYFASLGDVSAVCKSVKNHGIYEVEVKSDNVSYDKLTSALTDLTKEFNVNIAYACIGDSCNPKLHLILKLSAKGKPSKKQPRFTRGTFKRYMPPRRFRR